MRFFSRQVLLCLMLSISSLLFSQRDYEKGKTFYDEKEYALAAKSFEKALKEDPKSGDVLNYLGSSYYYNKDYQKAIEAFEKLEEADPDYWAWYIYLRGESHLNLEQLDQAAEDYMLFKAKYSKDPTRTLYHHQADFRIKYVEGRKRLLEGPPLMPDPVNLGKTINTSSGEYFPQIDPTGKTLYFTSQRKSRLSHLDGDDNNWGEDIYTARLNADGTFAEPVLMPEPINSNGHDGAAMFTGDGQMMVYSRCPNEGGVGSCDLYISHLEGESWSDPVNLGNVVNSKEWDAQASISADGTTIIFASNRAGGYGGSDLYMIKRNQFGEWGIPQNLGSMVNTPWSENSPYIAPDGRTLYFSSWGHPGLGGFDIFKSTLDNNQWSVPENLGQPLNSTGNDKFFTISASGEHAYFASEREDGLGQLDLYQVEIPEDMRPQATAVVSGVVTNAKDKKPISARIIIEDLNSGELVATNKSNSKSGEYLIVLPSGRTYGVTAYQKGYFFYSQSFDVPKESQYQELTKNIELKPIEKGARVVLNNIFFETGKAELSPKSRLDLDKAIELMQTNPSMVIEVGGHTDNVGDENANMRLSHERAKSVRQYMVDAGIASERIEAKGYGETTPVADNDTEEGRAANRRTEFIILEF